MELPYHIKTLEPLTGALDIIRYLGSIDAPNADSDEICDEVGISERTFGKAIRRLVTKGYVQMDGEMVYRLTGQGNEAVEILAAYDSASGDSNKSSAKRTEVSTVTRRLVVAVPPVLVAGQSNTVAIGLDGATHDESGVLYSPADVVVRFSVLNGEPSTPSETVFSLANVPVSHAFSVIPAAYDQVRLRVQVFQLGPNPDDINVAGGLYVDTHVSGTPINANASAIAYGSDIQIQELE